MILIVTNYKLRMAIDSQLSSSDLMNFLLIKIKYFHQNFENPLRITIYGMIGMKKIGKVCGQVWILIERTASPGLANSHR